MICNSREIPEARLGNLRCGGLGVKFVSIILNIADIFIGNALKDDLNDRSWVQYTLDNVGVNMRPYNNKK